MAAKGGAGAGAYVQVVGLSALATRVQLERLFGLAGPVTSLQTFWLHDPGEGTPGTLLGYVKWVPPPRSPPPPAPTTPHALASP